MQLSEYITQMREALKTPGAHFFYFPNVADKRKDRNMRLAREIGPALALHPTDQIESVIQSLYGMFIVANSLDRTGVQVNAKEWLEEMRRSIAYYSSAWYKKPSSPG